MAAAGCCKLRSRWSSCWSAATVGGDLERIAAAVNAGWHAAGFSPYELGYLLEPRLAPLLPAKLDMPLVWFGLFKTASRLTADEARHWLHARAGAGYAVRDGRLSMDRARYGDTFKAAQSLIGSGDVYQINLTLKYQSGSTAMRWACFSACAGSSVSAAAR